MTDLSELDVETLKRRAEVLARPFEESIAHTDKLSLLEFSLMGSHYALELARVTLAMRIGEILSIPLAPKHLQGIIRHRGESIALVSLKHFFHPETEGVFDSDFAVIVSARETRFALQVQDIRGVSTLELTELQAPPDSFDPSQLAYVKGITLAGMIVLDLESLVQAPGFGTITTTI
jgi:chemotaxis signal transduction protein